MPISTQCGLLSAHIITNLPAVTCNNMSTDFCKRYMTVHKNISLRCMSIVSIIWNNPTSLHLYIHLAVSLQYSARPIYYGKLYNAHNFLYYYSPVAALTGLNLNHYKWMMSSDADVWNKTTEELTYRVVTSVPTVLVRMLGKLLDACIWLDYDLMTTHFKLAEHAQLIVFWPVAWIKWVTWPRMLLQYLRRSCYRALCMSLLWLQKMYMTNRLCLPSWSSIGLKFQTPGLNSALGCKLVIVTQTNQPPNVKLIPMVVWVVL